jgi:hypothetical protein
MMAACAFTKDQSVAVTTGALLSDGTVAVVRVLDYHGHYTPDGKHTASATAVDWKYHRRRQEQTRRLNCGIAKVAADRMAAQNNSAFRMNFEVVAPGTPAGLLPAVPCRLHAGHDGNL